MIVRRLGPGDEDVVAALATRTPRTALLEDERTIFLVAFEEDEPAGFVLAYELLRRHGDGTSLFVYEVETAEAFRRHGGTRPQEDDVLWDFEYAAGRRADQSA